MNEIVPTDDYYFMERFYFFIYFKVKSLFTLRLIKPWYVNRTSQ